MWGGALPAPTACLPASRHLRSPTPAVLPRPFVLEVGSCWVGVPRGRGPRAPLGREGTPASPSAPACPTRVLLSPRLRLSRPDATFPSQIPPAPELPLPGILRVYTPPFPLLRHLRGLGEEGGRGRCEEEEKARRGGSPGTLLGPGSRDPPQRKGFSGAVAGRKARTPTASLRSRGAPKPPAGEKGTQWFASGRRIANERPLLPPPHPPGRVPARLCTARDPRAPAIVS